MQIGQKTCAEQGKRQLAALLLMVFLSPIFAVFLSATTQGNEAMLPACCRSHGRHQCFMRGHASQISPNGKNLLGLQLSERCPFSQLAGGSHLLSRFGTPLCDIGKFIYFDESNLASYAAVSKTTSSAFANPERGPPVPCAYFPVT
jgi:hypothetical protein